MGRPLVPLAAVVTREALLTKHLWQRANFGCMGPCRRQALPRRPAEALHGAHRLRGHDGGHARGDLRPGGAIHAVPSFDAAVEAADATEYGLTATVLTPSAANAQGAWRGLGPAR
jgi:hypothetical protein